ncbi:MAG TPA: PD-(D/E)XK nuclease family protein [Povalibacter sp.]|uniref:PD-(D/E)XK nuclease family protein n=1 Tax=Povalibacter sp. TaxID=1962978 RepID=UPI002CBA2EDF|nr:PD-(D/E)XK nuclease family protein [Povalibacter sp.]HMN43281.1 PD-(D/E)XK nuclease family protein [Povalibacter sp.]
MSLQSLLTEGVTVLTASRRLAHAVKQQFAREAQARGATIWQTPRVLPWSAWLRQQHLDARTKATAQWRVLSPAQARALWDDVVSGSRAASELLNPSSAARLAARSWRLLHDYLIPLDRLSSFDAPEAQALLAWCHEFSRRCAALGAIDEALLSHWAFDTALTPSERLAFAGFDTMPPAMTRLLDRWRSAGQVADAVESSIPGNVSTFEADDHDDELAVAAQWARDELAQGTQSIGIIVADLQSRRDEIRRVFEDVLAPGARHTHAPSGPLPAVIAAPAPLSSYPLVDAAMLVLQLLVGDAPSTQAGRLLRSVFIGGGETERGARAMADRRLREEQREGWNWQALERWAALTECEQLLLRSREVLVLFRALPSSALASEWAERFHQILRGVGWPGDRAPSSTEYQTLQKFQETLAEFGSLDPVTGRMNLRRAVGRLGDVLRDTSFEPETVSAAITVIDPSTSAGMHFDALWVTGLDADRWPGPASPDALIPLELQRAFGIPEATAAGMLQQATTQLDRWQRSAGRVVLSWAARDGDIELNRSPLLARLHVDDTLLAHATPTIALRELLFRERPPLDTLRDDRAPALPRQATRGGARTIELQSRCPFRAQAEIRLRAEVLPRVRVGIEPVDRGAILHRVLEDLWGGLRTQQRLLELDDAQIEHRVRESAQRHALQALSVDTPSRHRLAMLEIDSVTRQIVQLLQQEKLRPGFSVHLAEAKEAYEIGGLSITLRPDRIDQLDAGGELLIDYKLGASHTQRGWFDTLPGRPRQPQLPLYGLAHAERLRGLSYVILAPGAVEYRGWSDGTPIASGVLPYPAGIRTDLGDPADWSALLHHWQFTLTRLAEHYVAGHAEVDPLPQECTYCHLSTFCRVNELALESDEEGSPHDE